jgi:transposase InsO family protein
LYIIPFHFIDNFNIKKMEQEKILRQEAIRMYLQGESAQAISVRINRSRQWVHKWIVRYEQDPHGVSPLFIPPAEPWRNGIIEKFNDTDKLYSFFGTPAKPCV